MDESRFDDLTRRLASDVSRRSMLKGVAAGLFAGITGLVRADSGDAASCRADGAICRKAGDCCNGRCSEKDATGRRRCGCLSAADCPKPPVCNVAVCSDFVCSTAVDESTIGSPCGVAAYCDPVFNVQRAGDTCDDTGACKPGLETPCGQFVCGDSACLTTCVSDDDCVPAAHCEDDGVCREDLAPGSACDGPGDCLSGHCVDGVCCDTACADPCFTCTGAKPGTCSPETGTACDGGTCVGGSCCPAADVCGSGDSATCDCTETCCDGICLELGSKEHCAGCNDACVGNSDCCDGACTSLGTVDDCLGCGDACSGATSTCCATGCTDLTTNTNNCGSCGISCLSPNVGSAACCASSCTDLTIDVNNCNACGNVCTGDSPACCAAACADLATSMDNCGTCGVACTTASVQYAAAVTCAGGRCLATACVTGATLLSDGTCCLDARLCGSAPNQTCCSLGQSCCSGACTDTSLDPANCGGCGQSCGANFSCAGGVCSQGSFGEPCNDDVECSFYLVAPNDTCKNGLCCIPSGVECVKEQITFSGQCCSNTTLTCPSVGICP